MRLSVILLMTVIALAIGAALWTVGGPAQAKSERRDMTRWQDLQALAWHFDCLLQDGKAITDTSSACPNPPRDADPYSGATYLVDQVTERQITLCAAFETDLNWLRANRGTAIHDAERGCVLIRREVQSDIDRLAR
jgi:hypothetical protein